MRALKMRIDWNTPHYAQLWLSWSCPLKHVYSFFYYFCPLRVSDILTTDQSDAGSAGAVRAAGATGAGSGWTAARARGGGQFHFRVRGLRGCQGGLRHA
eukprot:1184411-Prorocentrum_minimum.AAC.1